MAKLKILTDAAKYDVSCSSSGHERRGENGRLGSSAHAGVCHSWTADGRCISLLKVLYSNRCAYDCEYCVNRRTADTPRASFTPEELADLTMEFYRRNYIEGLFLSSAVLGSPDATSEAMCRAFELLRNREGFLGYIHAKIVPGTSKELVDRIGRLADRVSVNIELPSAKGLELLAPAKKPEGILGPMEQITLTMAEQRSLVGAGNKYSSYRYRGGYLRDEGAAYAATGPDLHLPIAGKANAGANVHLPAADKIGSGLDLHLPIAGKTGSGLDLHLPVADKANVGANVHLPAADKTATGPDIHLPIADKANVGANVYFRNAAKASGDAMPAAYLSEPPDSRALVARTSAAEDEGGAVCRDSKGRSLTQRQRDASRFEKRERFAPAGQTTQLIIGATGDSDLGILALSHSLYRKFYMRRVYFSAYIPVNDSPLLPPQGSAAPLVREHRLYQADWLMRFYGFTADEIVDRAHPNLDLELDPKLSWALRHPEFFPVEINKASAEELLRIPGVGNLSVQRILRQRKVASLAYDDLKLIGVVLKRAKYFITVGGRYYGRSVRQDTLREHLLLQSGGLQLSLFDSKPTLPGE
ncbi:MAG TPA: putative DNA modification/repair radical SAM protein [Clostridiales bacterium]|nr:putative DNA modification/repair radical SAM protein [Clostridiales bacterium]